MLTNPGRVSGKPVVEVLANQVSNVIWTPSVDCIVQSFATKLITVGAEVKVFMTTLLRPHGLEEPNYLELPAGFEIKEAKEFFGCFSAMGSQGYLSGDNFAAPLPYNWIVPAGTDVWFHRQAVSVGEVKLQNNVITYLPLTR